MKGLTIYCYNDKCKKPIISNAYLRSGTYFDIRCFYCSSIIKINVIGSRIERKLLIIDKPSIKNIENTDDVFTKKDNVGIFIIDS